MKNIILPPVCTIILFVLASCSTIDDIVTATPYQQELKNSECLSSFYDTDSRNGDQDNTEHGLFQMWYGADLSTVRCKFSSLEYPCDFEKVNIKILFSENTLTIIEYPSSDNADCRCLVDAEFTINNLPSGDFVLKIYRGDTSGNYNPDKPTLVGNGRSITSGEIMKVKYPF